MGRTSSVAGILERIGGDDGGGLHFRVRIAGTGEQVFQNRLLFFEQAVCVDQILAGGEDLGVGAGHLDRGQSAFFHLRLGVRIQLFGRGDGLLLYLHVFVERHEIGVEPDHAINRGDQLLMKEQAW